MSELRDTRLEKAKTLEELGQGPYALTFSPSHRMAELQETHADLPKGEERDVSVSVAGRVMTRHGNCLLYTSPSPRDYAASRMPSSA